MNNRCAYQRLTRYIRSAIGRCLSMVPLNYAPLCPDEALSIDGLCEKRVYSMILGVISYAFKLYSRYLCHLRDEGDHKSNRRLRRVGT